jgi:hypothetical protein
MIIKTVFQHKKNNTSERNMAYFNFINIIKSKISLIKLNI